MCKLVCPYMIHYLLFILSKFLHTSIYTYMKNRIGWPLNSLSICQIAKALFFLCVLRSLSAFHSFVLFYFWSVMMVRNGRNFSIFRLFCLLCLTRLYLVARVKAWYNILSILALFFLALCSLKSRFLAIYDNSVRGINSDRNSSNLPGSIESS